ncbi:hypothetical protein KSP35_06420 [Aquihabitans sp. G128]|uniref:DUF6629 family protein n=1 Tax=Aquihabitans sp. G128 TaxID=2849779 RepID=UPI001C22F09E|nr:DUF6629 family protein [Aquihabitans sp. G128]QXC62432.1 hypothetical protein KSP35_06420 [Aquihabitans sp. G128]
MCFSPQADLAAGVFVGLVGIDAARHVRRRDQAALAALPLVLAGHQFVEIAVWRGLETGDRTGAWRPAMFAYLVVAFVVVPVLVPVAVAALEPRAHRRPSIAFVALGAVVAAALLHGIVEGPVDARIQGHHIDYRVHLWGGGFLVVLYLVATCGALLASHHRDVRLFGAVNLVAAVGLIVLDQRGFISLWCAWAAITSTAIAYRLRLDALDEQAPARATAGSQRSPGGA